MFFEGKSSQKYLGNIYKFFEKWNSFARVTTWQSSNIGCFFVAQFYKLSIAPGRMISKNYKFEKKWRKRKVKEYSKGIYVKFKPEEVEILHNCVFRLNGTACTLQREGCPLQTGSF